MTTGRREDVSMEDCTTARRGWARTLVAVRTLAAVGALLLLLGPGSVAAQVPASVQVIDESVTLFDEARTDSRSRGDVPQGTVLDVLSASGDWYHVLLDAAGPAGQPGGLGAWRDRRHHESRAVALSSLGRGGESRPDRAPVAVDPGGARPRRPTARRGPSSPDPDPGSDRAARACVARPTSACASPGRP